MSDRLVSIVVPVHDGARWIEATLASLLAQDHRPIEIVVVDDGSTDDSAARVRGFADVRLVQQDNAGVAAARNRGVAESHGDYLAFCDQDDRHLPTKTSRQLAYLDHHPDVALVMGRQTVELEPGVEPPAWLVPDEVFGDPGGVLPLSCLTRRAVYDAVGGFDVTMSGSDDFDWVARVKAAGHGVAVLPEVVLVRSVHDANASHRPGLLQTGTVRTIHKLLQARRQAGEP